MKVKILKKSSLSEISQKVGFTDVGVIPYQDYALAAGSFDSSFQFAKTILSFALQYDNFDPELKPKQYKFAKFTYGRDYHLVMNELLNQAILLIEQKIGNFEYKITVDTTLLDEKVIAKLAGIGFFGKNNIIISKKFGSFFVLGELVVDFEMDEYAGSISNGCNHCTRCIDACPTGAIGETFDRSKCLSFLTQKKLPFSDLAFYSVRSTIYGCDICQDVCPYNQKRRTGYKEFSFNEDSITSLDEFLALNKERYKEKYLEKTFHYVKYEVVLRNIIIAATNNHDITLNQLNELKELYKDIEWMRVTIQQAIERMGS